MSWRLRARLAGINADLMTKTHWRDWWAASGDAHKCDPPPRMLVPLPGRWNMPDDGIAHANLPAP